MVHKASIRTPQCLSVLPQCQSVQHSCHNVWPSLPNSHSISSRPTIPVSILSSRETICVCQDKDYNCFWRQKTQLLLKKQVLINTSSERGERCMTSVNWYSHKPTPIPQQIMFIKKHQKWKWQKKQKSFHDRKNKFPIFNHQTVSIRSASCRIETSSIFLPTLIATALELFMVGPGRIKSQTV